MPGPLDHVTIGAVDFAASLAFYEAALGALGWVRVHELRDEEDDDTLVEAVAWGPEGTTPVVWLVATGGPTRGLHIAVRAKSRAEVQTFFAQAVEHGGTVHSSPRPWALYRPGEFHAIVADPAGNLLEAVCAE